MAKSAFLAAASVVMPSHSPVWSKGVEVPAPFHRRGDQGPLGQGHSCSSNPGPRTQTEKGCWGEAVGPGAKGRGGGKEKERVRQPLEWFPLTEHPLCVGTYVPTAALALS